MRKFGFSYSHRTKYSRPSTLNPSFPLLPKKKPKQPAHFATIKHENKSAAPKNFPRATQKTAIPNPSESRPAHPDTHINPNNPRRQQAARAAHYTRHKNPAGNNIYSRHNRTIRFYSYSPERAGQEAAASSLAARARASTSVSFVPAVGAREKQKIPARPEKTAVPGK